MKKYSVLVQASPEEILHADGPSDLNLAQLQQWPQIKKILVVLPDLPGVAEALERLALWNFPAYVGDAYNVCRRIVTAHRSISAEPFAVRVLAIWKHLDLDYVDRLVEHMREINCDVLQCPRDFDVTFGADVASLNILERIAELQGGSQVIARAKFNPWGYMEMHPESFKVVYFEPAPLYESKKRSEVLSSRRCHPENEFFGRGYVGSRYHFFSPLIAGGQKILDIACGSGAGSYLLSKKSEFVLGVDYLPHYIEVARQRYPESDKLQFCVGDGQDFCYLGQEGWFDVVISLHTLEHVPDDSSMLGSLYRNLRSGGKLIVEVPLQSRRPLGVPVNPFHLREYEKEQFIELVKKAGFVIRESFGVCRSFYGGVEFARDALQVHAIKL